MPISVFSVTSAPIIQQPITDLCMIYGLVLSKFIPIVAFLLLIQSVSSGHRANAPLKITDVSFTAMAT